MQAVEAIERRMGADGLTSMLKSSAYLDVKQYDRAIEWGREAQRLEPDFETARFVLALALIGSKRYADAVQEYRVLEDSFGYEFERKRFEEDTQYAGFVKSSEFGGWLPK